MSKSKDARANEFAREIFKREWRKLDIDQQFFVYLHLKEFDQYLQAIKTRCPHTVNWNGNAFLEVREWYYSRIPLSCVFQAIDYCCKVSNKLGNVIRSIKYFSNQVKAQFELHKKSKYPYCYDWGKYGDEYPEYGFAGKRDRFFYTAYRIYQAGKSGYKNFDFWQGFY